MLPYLNLNLNLNVAVLKILTLGAVNADTSLHSNQNLNVAIFKFKSKFKCCRIEDSYPGCSKRQHIFALNLKFEMLRPSFYQNVNGVITPTYKGEDKCHKFENLETHLCTQFQI